MLHAPESTPLHERNAAALRLQVHRRRRCADVLVAHRVFPIAPFYLRQRGPFYFHVRRPAPALPRPLAWPRPALLVLKRGKEPHPGAMSNSCT